MSNPLSAQLRAIADQLDGAAASAPPPATPPNMVAVRPTGPLGQGKTRLYPNPDAVMNYAGQPVETIGGYASQIQENWGSTHFDFRTQAGLLYIIPTGTWQAVAPGRAGFPEVLDRMAYPRDWMTQSEIDRAAAEAERDKASGATFSPR